MLKYFRSINFYSIFYHYNKSTYLSTLGMFFSLDKAKKTFDSTPSLKACSFSSLYKSMVLVLHPKNNQTGPAFCREREFSKARRWCQNPLNGAIPVPGPISMRGTDRSWGKWKFGALKCVLDFNMCWMSYSY